MNKYWGTIILKFTFFLPFSICWICQFSYSIEMSIKKKKSIFLGDFSNINADFYFITLMILITVSKILKNNYLDKIIQKLFFYYETYSFIIDPNCLVIFHIWNRSSFPFFLAVIIWCTPNMLDDHSILFLPVLILNENI